MSSAARSFGPRLGPTPAPEDRHDEFVRLFVQSQPRLRAYVRAAVPNRADADEVLQEIGIVLWRKFGDFAPGSEFDHWALRVARLQILCFYKQSRRNPLRFSEPLLDTVLDASVPWSHDQVNAAKVLEICVSKLPTEERDLLQRRYRSPSVTARDVAREMGKPESTVYNALARIRRSLLHCVERTLGRD